MECQQILQSLQDYDVTPHIHWIPEHQNIKGNELADKFAKKSNSDRLTWFWKIYLYQLFETKNQGQCTEKLKGPLENSQKRTILRTVWSNPQFSD
jgi:ribonuclease HI